MEAKGLMHRVVYTLVSKSCFLLPQDSVKQSLLLIFKMKKIIL